jgi:hypothetical protein
VSILPELRPPAAVSRGNALPLFSRRFSAYLRYEVPAPVAGWQSVWSGVVVAGRVVAGGVVGGAGPATVVVTTAGAVVPAAVVPGVVAQKFLPAQYTGQSVVIWAPTHG